MPDAHLRDSAKYYTRFYLGIYNWAVIRLSNSFAWRCPSKTQLKQYNHLMGTRHLDVGPGTGWYLAHADRTSGTELHLMDLNPNSLQVASSQLAGRPIAAMHEQDILDPIPEEIGEFDSISMNYLLHCLPGTWAEKEAAVAHLAERLTDQGTLFGATILGEGVRHNLPGRKLMNLYNKVGVFHNRADDADGLRRILERHFTHVDVRVQGTVALFTASAPRR
jgi:SAM-dependent methyltransferase